LRQIKQISSTLTKIGHEPNLDSVGELVSQAQIRNTLFFIASSMYDFANTINLDSKTHDIQRKSANASEQIMLSLSTITVLQRGSKRQKTRQAREQTSARTKK